MQLTIFHLLDEPVPTLADPFPRDDPLPGAYELHLPADDVTIWYTVTEYEGQGRRLATLVETDLPKMSALMHQKITALEAYVAVTVPTASRPAAAGSTAPPSPPPTPRPEPGSNP